ncbi:MAG TPA: UpxY family transcription antiterminator [Candidatus Acidoferrales bacterium]|jgi:transcription antitermination factor NusG|nr:UpxY family transcription antiterminator [Candidatus Acidoferrales bacterium]
MQLTEHLNETSFPGNAPDWYALFVRYQHEKFVALGLSNKNIETYLPLCNSTRQWQDRAKQLWLPLFPSYVFVRENAHHQLQIISTPGVIHIVRFGGRPAIVSQSQISAVRKLLDGHYVVEPHPYLTAGDRVRIKTGPLAGVAGILTRKKNRAQLVISMEMLGRSAAVEIELSNVERIGPKTTLLPKKHTTAVA